jgi:hypothetical protein
MGVVMGVTAVVLGVAAGVLGLIVWTALFFPHPTARAGRALQGRPARCFLLGTLLSGALGLPVVALLHAPDGLVKLAGWALMLPLVAVLVVGLTSMAQVMGERLRSLSPAMTPLGGLVRGAVTLELAMLPPFLGWFLFAPLVGLTTLGAGAVGCVSRPPRSILRHGDTEDSEMRQVAAGSVGTNGQCREPSEPSAGAGCDAEAVGRKAE